MIKWVGHRSVLVVHGLVKEVVEHVLFEWESYDTKRLDVWTF